MRREQEAAIAKIKAEAEATARAEMREKARLAEEARIREEHEANVRAQVRASRDYGFRGGGGRGALEEHESLWCVAKQGLRGYGGL